MATAVIEIENLTKDYPFGFLHLKKKTSLEGLTMTDRWYLELLEIARSKTKLVTGSAAPRARIGQYFGFPVTRWHRRQTTICHRTLRKRRGN